MDALTLHRAAQSSWRAGLPLVPSILHVLMRAGFGASIAPLANVHSTCELGYSGLGVVIDDGVKIGRRTFIGQNVTVARRWPQGAAPRIGAYVYLGAGAQVLGDVTVGDFAVIGANAVVESDVAPGAIVVGNPARELKRIAEPAAQYERETGEYPAGVEPWSPRP
jgi:serine O-acetyltransferase